MHKHGYERNEILSLMWDDQNILYLHTAMYYVHYISAQHRKENFIDFQGFPSIFLKMFKTS